jgi:predicted porin
MKKSLVALAVLAVSGAAMAQSSVTLYGTADAALIRDDNGTVTVNKLSSGQLSGGKWGLKGAEDLGGGLKAIFTLENGYSIDTGAGATISKTDLTPQIFNRQSFVGFSGDFGTVKLGRQKNPVYATAATWDSFADSQAGDTGRLFNYTDVRTSNLMAYNFAANGFYGELQYGLGEVAGSSANQTVAGWVGYKSGPFDVVLTNQDAKDATDTHTTKITLIGGNYNFGVAKLFAAYSTEKTDGASVTLNQKDLHIGATVPVSTAGTVELSYVSKKDDLTSSADAHQVAIGYLYTLSKRTTLHTSYSQLSNDSKAKYQVTTAGNTDKLFMVGISHQF